MAKKKLSKAQVKKELFKANLALVKLFNDKMEKPDSFVPMTTKAILDINNKILIAQRKL